MDESLTLLETVASPSPLWWVWNLPRLGLKYHQVPSESCSLPSLSAGDQRLGGRHAATVARREGYIANQQGAWLLCMESRRCQSQTRQAMKGHA